MRKFLIMAIACIAGFQQASADVCKLKVRKEIVDALETHDEVWVDKDNGEVLNKWDKQFPKLGEGRRDFVHIVKNSVNAFADGRIKKEYKDAIFCNAAKKHKRDRVIISVGGAKDKQAEAKRQFENIIKCGLVNGKSLNWQIYDNPFNGNGWAMPGISAFVKNNVEEGSDNQINVYCAMKMPHPKCDYSFITKEEYGAILNGNFSDNIRPESVLEKDWCIGNYEHTERQLLLNYFADNEECLQFNVGTPTKKMNDIFHNQRSIDNGNLLIWTRGNPCVCGGFENGRYSCVQWYNCIAPFLNAHTVSVSIFFSELDGRHDPFVVSTEKDNLDNMTNNDYLGECLSRKVNYLEGYSDCASAYNIVKKLDTQICCFPDCRIKVNDDIRIPSVVNNGSDMLDHAFIPSDKGSILILESLLCESCKGKNVDLCRECRNINNENKEKFWGSFCNIKGSMRLSRYNYKKTNDIQNAFHLASGNYNNIEYKYLKEK